MVLAVSARAEGTVADSDLTLRTAVAVTNHTSGPIKLTRGPCAYPLILLDLYDTSGTDLWHNYLTASSCPDMSRDDEATVAPGATYTWTETDRPPITGPFQVRPGAAYTLKADLMQWHQGALAQIGQAGVPQGQHVLGQTTVTFQ